MRAQISWLALVLVAALWNLGGWAPANAAPQALGLVLTEGEVPLNCGDSGCQAEFTAFCLQPDRFSPASGTRYELISTDSIALNGRKIGGGVVALDAAKHLVFEAARNHVAMRISLPRRTLTELGLSEVSVAVKANTALLPLGGDRQVDDWGEGERSLVTGPLRTLGARIVDHNTDRMKAARLTSRIINALPVGKASAPEDVQALVRRSGGTFDPDELAPKARRFARNALELCAFAVGSNSHSDMRRCLQHQHDNLINFLNSRYWTAVKTGS